MCIRDRVRGVRGTAARHRCVHLDACIASNSSQPVAVGRAAAEAATATPVLLHTIGDAGVAVGGAETTQE
eukprot:3052805-Alexandrium_andersonii.AAC.1